MKPKLPRALLWRNKNTMDEMLKEPFGGQLYHMFMAMSRNMRMRFAFGMHLTILNEVFYQCTRVTYEKDPDAMVRNYSTDIKANVGGLQMTTRMVLMLMMYLMAVSYVTCQLMLIHNLRFGLEVQRLARLSQTEARMVSKLHSA
jgi:hypothetical protein